MINNKKFNFLLFSFFVLLFSFLIFLFNNIEENHIIEENYIEPTLNSSSYDFDIEENKVDMSKIVSKLNKIKEEDNKDKVFYNYIPNSLWDESKTTVYKNFFDTFFLSKTINSKINNLQIDIYKANFEVRWRLKNWKIYIFWLHSLWFKEALSVAIHEFWHFYDLYILKKNVFKDISYDFYNISWEKADVLKSGSNKNDFVSWYSMTNRYEDFAESFNFYILHNKEFEKRAKKSDKLQKKYDFFKNYVFIKNEFITDKYSINEYEDYIWDTTKLDFDFLKFKKYLLEMD